MPENGIRIGAAHDVFMRVVEKLGIPVVTGADSIDCIYDEHPLYIGKGGNVGDRRATSRSRTAIWCCRSEAV